jgi:multidrug efflux pump subunit AcrB
VIANGCDSVFFGRNSSGTPGDGGFFTATSMIGFIAGAAIVVRNSIILVDFFELRLSLGKPLKQAVIDAGAVCT